MPADMERDWRAISQDFHVRDATRPEAWLRMSRQQYGSAKTLRKSSKALWKDVRALMKTERQRGILQIEKSIGNLNASLLLLGYAIENALKAIALKLHFGLSEPDLFLLPSSSMLGHRLSKIASSCEIILNANEVALLEHFEEVVKWAGKYPSGQAPTSKEKFQKRAGQFWGVPEGGFGQSTHDALFKQGSALWRKLVQIAEDYSGGPISMSGLRVNDGYCLPRLGRGIRTKIYIRTPTGMTKEGFIALCRREDMLIDKVFDEAEIVFVDEFVTTKAITRYYAERIARKQAPAK